MFWWPKKTSDDLLIERELRWKPLSWGMFIEVHVSSLLGQELKLHSDFEIKKGIFIWKGFTVSNVKKVKEPVQKEDTEEVFFVDKVVFLCNGSEYTVSEWTFSMLLKKCFHTQKSTVCFSLRDEDKPQS